MDLNVYSATEGDRSLVLYRFEKLLRLVGDPPWTESQTEVACRAAGRESECTECANEKFHVKGNNLCLANLDNPPADESSTLVTA